ncbi:uncharacterized protein LOC117292123 [Asterias rubens]|uniref:uncharacterized protein LOC117292123 n=1 Tax=Asterias rubens TaxID=7604 RepID=UPI0014555360|nr:uncharacterized protein LOC117292123 [Asterias rubens]
MGKLSLLIMFSLLAVLEAKRHCFNSMQVDTESVQRDESGKVTGGSLNAQPITKCNNCTCTVNGPTTCLLDCCTETPRDPIFDESKCEKDYSFTEACEFKLKKKNKDDPAPCVITGYKE